MDRELERLKTLARRYATENGQTYCVANLNRIGARVLVVRPLAVFQNELERVVFRTDEEGN